HPDRNPSPEAHDRFIEIQKAYEVLSDESQRSAYLKKHGRRNISAEELERRERIYREWVQHQYDLAQKRRKDLDEEEESSPLLKKLNLTVNLFFMLFCLVVILVPMWKYAEQQDMPVEEQKSIFTFIFPMIAGLVFAVW